MQLTLFLPYRNDKYQQLLVFAREAVFMGNTISFKRKKTFKNTKKQFSEKNEKILLKGNVLGQEGSVSFSLLGSKTLPAVSGFYQHHPLMLDEQFYKQQFTTLRHKMKKLKFLCFFLKPLRFTLSCQCLPDKITLSHLY